MRKSLGMIAIAAAAALALTACGGGGDTKGETGGATQGGAGGKVELKMLAATYSDNTKSIWEGIIKAFNAKNPDVSISLEMQSWENINDVIRTKVQSNDTPDILSIDAFAGYVQDDLLYSADEILSPDTVSNFQDSFRENASMNGKQYGFPLIASDRALFINDDLAAKAGIQPPKTWDELKAAAKAIKDKTGKYGYGMPLGSEEAQAEAGIWFFTGGGGYGTADKVTVDTPENLAASQFMKSMIDEGVTQPDPGSTQRTPMLNVFMQGEMGMAVGLPPIVGMIEDKAPKLKYSIHPFPSKDGAANVTLGVADHLMAFKNDGDKGKQVGAFLDFFFQDDNYLSFVDKEGFLPTTKTGAEKTTLKDKFQTFIDLLPNAKFYPSTAKNWATTQGALQSDFGRIAKDDPAKVLKDIQAESDAG